jgi:uncharacterized protein (DUF486 family)
MRWVIRAPSSRRRASTTHAVPTAAASAAPTHTRPLRDDSSFGIYLVPLGVGPVPRRLGLHKASHSPPPPPRAAMATVLLLIVSNVFMTFAWYGHLKHRSTPLIVAILVSWGIAFFEYCFQVPANRMGYGRFSAAQLKTIQEVISLSVFAVFSVTYLKEALRWNHVAAFALIVAAVFVMFYEP